MRIGVVARGTHSLHLERGFDMLKRNLSLESRSNIKSWLRVCLWRIRHYDEPIIPRRFLLLLFLTFKNLISTIKLSSNHLLKVNQIEQFLVGTILYFYYFGKTIYLRFCSSSFWRRCRGYLINFFLLIRIFLFSFFFYFFFFLPLTSWVLSLLCEGIKVLVNSFPRSKDFYIKERE